MPRGNLPIVRGLFKIRNSAVPEPATMLLLIISALGGLLILRKRSSNVVDL
jgi:hypothetical protein